MMTRFAQIQDFFEITRDTPKVIAGKLVDGRILADLILFTVSTGGNASQSTQIETRVK